ncbi:class I SAM-dependent methyltransferase, partial [candidate division FCPU426 bacterium]|nr:class I SAM-dependent methyltransferase [candidate division FCPU426 bacterium]
MEKQIYHDLAKAGNRYWWNQGRQYLVKKLFAQFAGGQQSTVKRRILDIGCAAGGTLYTLAGWGEVWGLDISPEAIALCRSWGIAKNRLVLGDAEKMACFSKDRFDLVTAVEIIEHLDNPGKALAEIKRVLKP